MRIKEVADGFTWTDVSVSLYIDHYHGLDVHRAHSWPLQHLLHFHFAHGCVWLSCTVGQSCTETNKTELHHLGYPYLYLLLSYCHPSLYNASRISVLTPSNTWHEVTTPTSNAHPLTHLRCVNCHFHILWFSSLHQFSNYTTKPKGIIKEVFITRYRPVLNIYGRKRTNRVTSTAIFDEVATTTTTTKWPILLLPLTAILANAIALI